MLDLHRWDWQLWHWVLLYQYTTPAWCWNFVTWAHCEQVHDYTSKCWKLLYCGRVLCWVYQPGMEVKNTFVLWINFGETIYTWVCRHVSRPSVVKCPMVNVQLPIPVLHGHLVGYFSQAVLWEMMAQFSFPLCCSFPTISSKSYIVANYALNIQFTLFCQTGVGSYTCA